MGQLQQPQQSQQQRRDGEQQQGAAGGGAAPDQIRVLIPEPQAHSQRSGGIGPEQLGQIHHRHPVGGYRIEGQAQGGPQRRQQQAPPDLGVLKPRLAPATAGAPPWRGLARRAPSAAGRGLLEDQCEDQPKPGGIAQGLPVGGSANPVRVGESRRSNQPEGRAERQSRWQRQRGAAPARARAAGAANRRPGCRCGPAAGRSAAGWPGSRRRQSTGSAVPSATGRLGQQQLQVGSGQPLSQQLPAPASSGRPKTRRTRQ